MNDNPQAASSLTAWMCMQEEINKEVAIQLSRLDIELTAAVQKSEAKLSYLNIENERLQKLLDAARFGSDKIAVPNY